jgi:serine/threonine protein kinase
MIKRSTGSSAQKCDVYSLGITFIECAFAFHYYDNYIECIKNKESSKLMNAIFRYVPPTESQPELESLILSSVIQNNDGDWNIIDEKHPIDKIVYTKNTDTEPMNYTLEDLYRDILEIHERYPIFKKMIKINPDERCSINNVITVCLENIRLLQ